ncbi:MAG: class I tRNA ligase family protein [Ginsengibacter sp.]
MEYNFREIEKKWQKDWKKSGVYEVSNSSGKPKFYVLDMFPYPSGAGLHVGHPLGYISSDIYARYKRLRGFNVLHPMGYDSFGLPAEQYALETGQHPAVTTEKNIETYREQLDSIGFSFDWSREVRTSAPSYYKWTQWIFLQIFSSWYDKNQKKARGIEELIKIFDKQGNAAGMGQRSIQKNFTAEEWKNYSTEEKQTILMEYRLAFLALGEVNWCEALGTVLANDEVINGVSERGGHPVVKRKMRQWYLRITDYAERLLQGLTTVEYTEAMKEMQRNWIGKSEGAELEFEVNAGLNSNLSLTPNPGLPRDPSPQGEGSGNSIRTSNSGGEAHSLKIKVYTTRPDTIFGVDFMVLAPEHELVSQITTPLQKRDVEAYLEYVKSRSERERLAEVKSVTGAFTGAYAINPFNGREIPVWIAEYVLAGYGTGAIMAVPCGDQRDFDFATHFKIPITNIIGEYFNGKESNATKEAVLSNSAFLNGVKMENAIGIILEKIEKEAIGHRKVNYKMRDAGFSRQRYWGEPFPIIYKNGIAYPVDEKELPVELPHVENYSPGPEGEGPLANIPEWVNLDGGIKRETNTMPGYAGSSWYFLRYMDPHNDEVFADKKAMEYWNQVDVYVGGTEHAVGHLLYSRMWTKVLCDLGFISFDEPYKKLVNQGMIQGSSRFVYRLDRFSVRINGEVKDLAENSNIFLSLSLVQNLNQSENEDSKINSHKIIGELLKIPNVDFYHDHSFKTSALHIDVNLVDGIELDIQAFKNSKPEYANAIFILEDGKVISPGEDFDHTSSKYICGVEVEKMSKSKFNTVNPNMLVEKYGADTFRMYEMFLGPVEQSKPWDTKGIEGVHRFLKKLWRLFYDDIKGKVWTEEKATDAAFKVLHKTIKKVEEDTERFSYNTAVSTFMVCVNELTDLQCHKKEILQPLLILLAPYAPHVAEELYHALGNNTTIVDANYPNLETKYLIESEKEYPVSINGKLRTTIVISLDASQDEVEKIALNNEIIQKWMEGKAPKKIIYVRNKMVNVVV